MQLFKLYEYGAGLFDYVLIMILTIIKSGKGRGLPSQKKELEFARNTMSKAC